MARRRATVRLAGRGGAGPPRHRGDADDGHETHRGGDPGGPRSGRVLAGGVRRPPQGRHRVHRLPHQQPADPGRSGHRRRGDVGRRLRGAPGPRRPPAERAAAAGGRRCDRRGVLPLRDDRRRRRDPGGPRSHMAVPLRLPDGTRASLMVGWSTRHPRGSAPRTWPSSRSWPSAPSRPWRPRTCTSRSTPSRSASSGHCCRTASSPIRGSTSRPGTRRATSSSRSAGTGTTPSPGPVITWASSSATSSATAWTPPRRWDGCGRPVRPWPNASPRAPPRCSTPCSRSPVAPTGRGSSPPAASSSTRRPGGRRTPRRGTHRLWWSAPARRRRIS
jgi:hypothetical protein